MGADRQRPHRRLLSPSPLAQCQQFVRRIVPIGSTQGSAASMVRTHWSCPNISRSTGTSRIRVRRLDGATERRGALFGAPRARRWLGGRFAVGEASARHRRWDDRSDRRIWSARESKHEGLRRSADAPSTRRSGAVRRSNNRCAIGLVRTSAERAFGTPASHLTQPCRAREQPPLRSLDRVGCSLLVRYEVCTKYLSNSDSSVSSGRSNLSQDLSSSALDIGTTPGAPMAFRISSRRHSSSNGTSK